MEAMNDCCMGFAWGASMCNVEGLPTFENYGADCCGNNQMCNYINCIPYYECDPCSCYQGFVTPAYPVMPEYEVVDSSLGSCCYNGCFQPSVATPSFEYCIDVPQYDIPQLISKESTSVADAVVVQPHPSEHNETLYTATSLTLPCFEEPASVGAPTTVDSNEGTEVSTAYPVETQNESYDPQPVSATSLTEGSTSVIPSEVMVCLQAMEQMPTKPCAQQKPRRIVDNDDADWADSLDKDSSVSSNGRSRPNKWSQEECQRLREAVKNSGATIRWSEVAKYVGTRSMGQCINKWKNSLCKKRERWTSKSSEQLQQLMKRGLKEKEIVALMPQFTYIQIYQQIRKLSSNTKPWAEWELEKLVRLKSEGTLGDTEIGRLLDNRHRDAVKNMWNHIRKQQGF